ncbi:MAG TPA: sugar phosphate isomerase/epimerase [Pyrinomonadaceae bacterium]|nr:sugar phosphate isomerase/epimerase [Pyrinomonadaceae bacterium]
MPAVTAAAKIAARQSLHVGCQTNAWRIDPRDFSQVLAVLKEIKELGYEGFETGFRNLQGQFGDAPRARREIEQTGLAFFGAHIFLTQYDAQTNIAPFDLITNVVDGAARLGAQRLILSGGPAPDKAALGRKIAALDAAGKYAKAKGLRRISYHNHAPEFSSGGAEIDALYRETDPELTGFVLDCGHAHRAGINVAEFFARHHARIDGLHLRDYRGDNQVPLGQGDFDLRALAAAARRAKWSGWVLNEEERADGTKPGAEAVRPARQALRQTFGI